MHDQAGKPTPPWVVVASAGIGAHAFNHITVVVQDLWRLLAAPETAGFNPGTIYHPVSAVLYIWLAAAVYTGRRWSRVAITVLLVFQAVGRYFVFVSYPSLEVRADLVTGWALSVVVVCLLWIPTFSRHHFTHALRWSRT